MYQTSMEANENLKTINICTYCGNAPLPKTRTICEFCTTADKRRENQALQTQINEENAKLGYKVSTHDLTKQIYS